MIFLSLSFLSPSVSQVCLAEGTTVYIDLESIASATFVKPSACDKNHYVACGYRASTTCPLNGPAVRSNDEPHAVRCCADYNPGGSWTNAGCQSGNLWVVTPTPCEDEATFETATGICTEIGGRLCTKEELVSQIKS